MGAAIALNAGVNDLGGTLMNESITRAAGAQHGQESTPEQMEELVARVGRRPVQRTTLYKKQAPNRVNASFGAAELLPIVNRPFVRKRSKTHGLEAAQ
jgi:FO synthase